jgi:hypothetical protein
LGISGNDGKPSLGGGFRFSQPENQDSRVHVVNTIGGFFADGKPADGAGINCKESDA